MRRHEVSDAEWALLKELLPTRKGPGRPPADARMVLNGMFWILNTGAPWRDLPERYGPWRTVYDRFNLWSRDGTLDRILAKLQLRLDAEGRIDWDVFCIDGSVVRASRAAAGAKKNPARRAGKSCFGPLAGRFLYKIAPFGRWTRLASGRHTHSWATA